MMIDAILHLTKKYHGNWNSIYESIIAKEKIDILIEKDAIKNKDYIFITEDNYPNKLKDILMPPFFVFYKGNINLIDEQVLSINGDISSSEFKLLLDKQNSEKYVLCLNNEELKEDIFNLSVKHNRKIIIVCEGGISKFKFNKDYKNLLLVSEYNDPNTYKKSEKQTVERIIFAFSNILYINSSNNEKIKNLLSNIEQKSKNIYCKYNSEFDFSKLKYANLDMQYLENIYDIV